MRGIFLIVFLMSGSVWAVDKTEKWAKKVIKLRTQVEILNEEYRNKKDGAHNDLKSLTLQRTELESNVRGEKIRNQQLTDKMKQMKNLLSDESVESKELLPSIHKTIEALEAYVKNSLPFKINERLSGLEDLKSRLEKGEVSSVKASNQLWALLEDEKRLAKETSLHKQTIPLSGKMKLAEVAKVGMQFLYFKTDSNDYGMAKRVNNEWVFIPFRDEVKRQQTLVFMDSLKKQIRQGYFDLPTEI